MANPNISNLVADEIALQQSMGFQIEDRIFPPAPADLFEYDEHTKVYLPPVEDDYLAHSIIVSSAAELAEVFETVESRVRGHYRDKDSVVAHERLHAEAALRLGQSSVRYGAHLKVQPPTKSWGRRIQKIAMTPFVVLENVEVSRLGVGVFLASQIDSKKSKHDTVGIRALGYTSADAVITTARRHNEATHSNTYPILRKV